MKILPFALAGALAAASPAFAQTENDQDVRAGVEAINEDNADLQRHNSELEQDRAAKAKAKAEGDITGQAVNSVKIGADHTKIAAKKAKKSMDKKMLEHDKKQMRKEATEE